MKKELLKILTGLIAWYSGIGLLLLTAHLSKACPCPAFMKWYALIVVPGAFLIGAALAAVHGYIDNKQEAAQ